MARPLRIEFAGAVYHVTSRGDRREMVFEDDEDRLSLLGTVGHMLGRFDAQVLAYCLMGNHYHFLLLTRDANLSMVMRQINGVYTQAYNRRHSKVGHLFQGRYKAILVDRDAYLLEACRYIELNPVRARLVARAEDWAWSSYRAHVCEAPAPAWLDRDGLHGYLLGHAPRHTSDQRRAAQRYAVLVEQGRDVDLWNSALRQQIYLGDDAFVARMQALMSPQRQVDREMPRLQRQPPLGLDHWLRICASRDEALWRAHTTGGLTMSGIARALGLSVSRVSRIIAAWERRVQVVT